METMKPWVRNLIALFLNWRSRELVPHVFQALSGGERAFSDIQRVRNMAHESVPRPKVYYVGIGNIGSLNLDLLYPLLATDFSELTAVDMGPRQSGLFFDKFIQAVTLNLSLVDEINQEEISFSMLSEDIFSAGFIYDGMSRRVNMHINFDATASLPPELSRGYQVLFTRRTNALFAPGFINAIPEETKNAMLSFLAPQGLAVFQELVGDEWDIQHRTGELLRWLGDDFEVKFASADGEPSYDKIMCFGRKT